MRAMALTLRSGLCVVLAVLATAASAAAPKQPRLPPGMAKYIMVLWEPGTRKPNGETAKRGEEPDVAQHGGRVEASWSSHRVIVVPLAAVRQLRAHQGVAYLQRVWTGESREEWLEPEPGPGPSAGARVASESDTDLTWGPVQYAYDSSGNIKQMGTAAELQAQAEDHYTYDSAGRLIGSRVNGKTERYQYDAFGNLTSKSVDGEVAVTNTVDGASNRLAGEIYDAAGNVTTSRSGHALRYDSLNMVSSIRRFDTRRWMVYDASDERIGVVNGPDLSRWTIRGLNGQVLREFTGFETSIGNPYWEWKQDSIYADGRLVAGDRQIWPQYEEATTRYGGRRHYHLDHLGSVRVVTDREGRSISEHEYMPFGATQTRTHQEQIDPGDPHLDTHRFAGHTRDFLGSLDEDAANYLDYMHARYYDPNRGRFLSVDPSMDLKANLPNPQRWNRYSYVSNNPINKIDPDGRDEYAMMENAPRTQAELQQLAAFNRKWLPIALAPAGGAALSTLARVAFTAFPRLFLATMGVGAGMTGAVTGPNVNLGSGARPIVGAINVDNLSPGFRGSMQQVQVAANALALPFKNSSIGNVTAQNLPSVLLGQGGQQLAGELGRTMQSGSTLSITTQTPGALAHFAKLLGRYFDDVRIEGNRLTAVRQ